MIKITSLSKTYANSEKYAVKDVSLHVKKGENNGFIGPNGAGKTTTIKSIIGVITPTSGKIEIDGEDITKGNGKQKIGYVSDVPVPFDKLTGSEYVNFLASVYGVSVADKTARVEKLLNAFDFKKEYNAQISTYSHGQKQKISIIGALVHEPSVWILDEPLTGLDPRSAHVLKTLMREHCDKGNCVFFSTHVLEVAEKLCDRVGIISNGSLIKEGTIEEILGAQKDGSLEEFFLSITNKE